MDWNKNFLFWSSYSKLSLLSRYLALKLYLPYVIILKKGEKRIVILKRFPLTDRCGFWICFSTQPIHLMVKKPAWPFLFPTKTLILPVYCRLPAPFIAVVNCNGQRRTPLSVGIVKLCGVWTRSLQTKIILQYIHNSKSKQTS